MNTEPIAESKQAERSPLPELHIGSRSGYNAAQIYIYDGEDEHHDSNILQISNMPLNTRVAEIPALAKRIPAVGEAFERAKAIVRAANSHQMLVDALTDLLGYTTALRTRLAAAGGILEATSSEMTSATAALKRALP